MLDNDWLTIRETAAYLRCCQMTVHRYIKDGKLDSIQRVPKGKRLISAESIKKLTSACTHLSEGDSHC